MDNFEANIIKAGFKLPSPPAVAGLYSPAIITGNLVYTSGQLPLLDGKLIEPGGKGKVNELRKDDAFHASRVALLDTIEKIVKLTLYVSSESFFSSQHLVANGASSLLHEIFGKRGVHTRSAVGVTELPLDASLELELIVQYKPAISQ